MFFAGLAVLDDFRFQIKALQRSFAREVRFLLFMGRIKVPDLFAVKFFQRFIFGYRFLYLPLQLFQFRFGNLLFQIRDPFFRLGKFFFQFGFSSCG